MGGEGNELKNGDEEPEEAGVEEGGEEYEKGEQEADEEEMGVVDEGEEGVSLFEAGGDDCEGFGGGVLVGFCVFGAFENNCCQNCYEEEKVCETNS